MSTIHHGLIRPATAGIALLALLSCQGAQQGRTLHVTPGAGGEWDDPMLIAKDYERPY